MSRLHELLAVEADKNNIATKLIEESRATLGKKPDHFNGFTRQITYFDEKRAAENSEETKLVVSTVDDNLEYTLNHVASYFDVILQKEMTNQTAVADLVVDGVMFATKVPATFLLGMETRIKALRALFEAVPTLPPAIAWVPDTNSGPGHYRSPRPRWCSSPACGRSSRRPRPSIASTSCCRRSRRRGSARTRPRSSMAISARP